MNTKCPADQKTKPSIGDNPNPFPVTGPHSSPDVLRDVLAQPPLTKDRYGREWLPTVSYEHVVVVRPPCPLPITPMDHRMGGMFWRQS